MLQLTLEERNDFGKKMSAERKLGRIPGEIYGHGKPNRHIFVGEKELMKIYRAAGSNTLITLTLGNEKIPALIVDLSVGALSERPKSVDFHQIDTKEKMRIHVPIVLSGEAPAQQNGFDIIQTLQEVEIETLPTHIPHEFTIDISGLHDTSHDITVKEIAVPKEIKMITPLETVVVAVTEKQKEEEIPVTPEVTAPETSEVKTKTETK